ncbi:MAG TPA: M23 family metallopeptidase [Candidatus Udaeobacter sp.]|nr:M23 family metallopeptidase [Candidatus Udaeobacter sp.]
MKNFHSTGFHLSFVIALSAIAGAMQATPQSGGDTFTPVIASTLSPETWAVRGTDGVYHLVYEVQLTNTKLVPALIRQIDVVDAADHSKIIASFSGTEVINRMRTLVPQPASDATIEPNVGRLFYIELAFKSAETIPRALEHHLHFDGAANPGPSKAKPLDYFVGRLTIAGDKPVVIGPPLSGERWVAANGCCNPEIIHRGSVQSVNGALYDAQRFAIDWMRLDEQGRLVHDNPADVHNYADYGAEVLAVADGTVVSTLNDLDDQEPGKLPDPSTITMQTVDGNHVVLDIGGGRFAFYAHLQKNSVNVHAGDRVKKGAVLGMLGNSGNTSAPHLHFHIVNSPSVLGSDGLPYVIDKFDFTGQVDPVAFEAAPGIEGNWGQGRIKQPEHREREFPLNLNIIDFPSPKR